MILGLEGFRAKASDVLSTIRASVDYLEGLGFRV